VRFVIVDGPRLAAARALRVPVAYQGDGITVFEVPAEVPAIQLPLRVSDDDATQKK
jgi:hypothetical protein